jgi:hypothetical protein
MTLIQNPTPTSLPKVPEISPIPSPNVVHIFSPEPEALPTPPWFLDSLYEDFPHGNFMLDYYFQPIVS